MDQRHARELLPFAGLLPLLAITKTLGIALVMSAAVASVLLVSMILASLIRSRIPLAIRELVIFTIIASLVTIVDQILMTTAFGLQGELSIYVGLIITSCIVFGRVEMIALHEAPLASARAGLWHGMAFSLLLCLAGGMREILGTGAILGRTVLPLRDEGGWFPPFDFALLAPGALFLAGGLLWAGRSLQIVLAKGKDEARARGGGQ